MEKSTTPLVQALPDLLPHERLERIRQMSPEEKEAYRRELLAQRGVTVDDKGREYFTLPRPEIDEAGLIQKLIGWGFPKSPILWNAARANTNWDTQQKDLRRAAAQKQWIYISGAPNTGKTTLAMTLGLRMLTKSPGFTMKFMNTAKLFEGLLNNDFSLTWLMENAGELIVLDDLNPAENDWRNETMTDLLGRLREDFSGQVVLTGMFPLASFDPKDAKHTRLLAKLKGAAEIRLNRSF